MKVGSLFSGIGGMDLGLEMAGMEIIWQSEIDPYASAILRKHWPNVPNIGDITTVNPATLQAVDLVCGGYPCQPFSVAGRRQGERDDRHLWPIMRQIVAVVRPAWVLCENVAGHITMGLDSVLSTWKHSATPASRLLFRLVPSMPRTGGTGCGFWPTATASQARSEGAIRQMRWKVERGEVTREEAEQMIQGSLEPKRMGFWPTPNASPLTSSLTLTCSGDGRTRPNKLGWAVAEGFYPTPAAKDWRSPNKKPYAERGGGKKGGQLPNFVGGSLNPAWVEWLQGFPVGWTDLNASEMPSSRKSHMKLDAQ